MPEISHTLDKNYDHVFDRGTLISLNISVWGMSTQLHETDLSIETQPEIIKLGKKFLFKPSLFNEFKRIESGARRCLYKHAHKFPIAEAHFVAHQALDVTLQELTQFQTKFFEQVDKFCSEYENNKEEVRTDFPEHWEKLSKLYPTVDNLRKKFNFSWTLWRITMPKEFGEYDLNAKIAEEQTVNEAKTRAQQQLQEQAQKQSQMLYDFVQDVGVKLREAVLQQSTIIVEKIKNKEIISKTNINSLLRQITDFNELNFLDDTVVSEKLEQLKQLLNDQTQDFKTSSASIELLESNLTDLIKETEKTGDIDTLTGKFFRPVEVDDN